ncbi:MAG TPA: YkgJ family cysteine cluster protein [Acetobacteraceae bacterium]|nr:YkgJ family cysteine cluster protein [Acetobacteraceae bacterium]
MHRDANPLKHAAMPAHERLDCLKCPSLCCRMAGYVRVSRDDIRRLAKFLNLSVAEFEKRHIVETTRKGEKRIKQGFKTCQFLSEDRLCSVYEARPHDCRGYVCWNQEDETVYDYAAFLQKGVSHLRDVEKDVKK